MTTPTRSPHVLLIEDNEGDIDLIKDALREVRQPYTISVVKDGKNALDYLIKRNHHDNAQTPDVIILDLELPKFKGEEIMTIIDRHPQLRRIPLIVHTSSFSDSVMEKVSNNKRRRCVPKGDTLGAYDELAHLVECLWSESEIYA